MYKHQRDGPHADRLINSMMLTMMALMLSALAYFVFTMIASARDDGRYANSKLKPWFDSLKSSKGPCCSDADGTALSDVDWESDNGHYRVRIEGVWYDVPDDAVLKQPNLYGRTMVWPIRGWSGKSLEITIRCFIPGMMT